ncbi:MAG: aldo/keto reductase [Alphaproteobacteria bacterium]|nr:aldo/keto reductase [Alphaproteobacteria bacterium]
MELRNLGTSGLKVSLVGLGCNNFGGRIDLEGTRKVIHRALDLGITLFDTADVYGDRGGSETCMGQVLGDRRKDIVLATKFAMPMGPGDMMKGASRRYIFSAVEASLKRLKTDWIDLYQIHQYDTATPIEETMRTLDDLVRLGKVRYVGCSNFPAWRVVEAQWTAKSLGLNAFIACQDHYSLLFRDIEAELVPAMRAYGLGLLPFFPLASGLLTGKYRKGKPMPTGARLTKSPMMAERFMGGDNLAIVERLDAFCRARGRTLLELAFSWLAARPMVASVIAGATRPDQLDQNVAAVQWSLSNDDMDEIARLLRPGAPENRIKATTITRSRKRRK